MSHHPSIRPVERVCICQPPTGDHSPECNEQHRLAFFAAWRGLRAELGWPDEDRMAEYRRLSREQGFDAALSHYAGEPSVVVWPDEDDSTRTRG